MISVLTAVLLALASVPASVTPRPIGVGAVYHPAPAPLPVLHALRFRGLSCATERESRFGVHLEVFVQRRVVIVPAGIGVARPLEERFGTVIPRGCTYSMRTLTPTGVIEVRAGSRVTLGDFFRLWGQPLRPHRLVGARSSGRVVAFVGGRRWRGTTASIPLERHGQIVLELGGYVPPHAYFLFSKGL